MAGLWGLWHVSHGIPFECSAGTTCGKPFGFAALAV